MHIAMHIATSHDQQLLQEDLNSIFLIGVSQLIYSLIQVNVSIYALIRKFHNDICLEVTSYQPSQLKVI